LLTDGKINLIKESIIILSYTIIMSTKKSVLKLLSKLDVKDISHIPIKEIIAGIKHEYEHLTNDNEKLNLKVKNKKMTALKIALVHLIDRPDYYIILDDLNL
jgi:hypothetical protein